MTDTAQDSRSRGPVLVLTGFMGAGKSTIGRAAAQRLGTAFIDTDAEIERTSGRSIAAIFADDGEPAFRDVEEATVLRVLAEFDGVVALGGGSVTVPGIRAALLGRPLIHLRVSPDTGFARVADSNRPLLAGDDPGGTYARLLAQRAALYDEVATASVDADLPVDAVVAAVLAVLDPARKDHQS